MKSTKNKIGTVLPKLIDLTEAGGLLCLFKEVSVMRINAFFMCLACMLDQRTSCLSKAAAVFNKVCGCEHKPQKKESVYQSFLRIFSNGNTERLVLGLFCLVVRLLGTLGRDLEIILDRTHWEYRGRIKNVLVLGCICHGVFIPLIFRDLGRKGKSNFEERKALIERFLRYWEATKLPLPQFYLAGDREFIGVAWWSYLKDKNIQFAFHIKEGQKFHIWLNGDISDTRYKVSTLRAALGVPNLSHAEIVLLGYAELINDIYSAQDLIRTILKEMQYYPSNST